MKIALCKSRLVGPVSGADETLVTYAVQLRDAGHDVEVVTLYPCSPRDPYYRRLVSAGIPIRVIVERAWMFSALQLARNLATHALFVFVLLYGFANHARSLWTTILHLVSGFYAKRCRSFFAQHRYDVVHVLTPDSGTPVLIRACRAAGLPTLYQELGSPHHPEADRHYARLQRVIPLCTSVVALSPALAEQWSGRFHHPRGVGVLPLLVAPPTLWEVPRRPMPFDVIFGFSGRLDKLKGTLDLVRAFAGIRPQGARPYLRVAGEGPQAYSARRLAFDLGVAGSCDFVGRYSGTDGRSAFLDTVNVFVLPSFTEGTPNSIIEAMASGIPIIAYAVGGIPDIVTEESGLLVTPGDTTALSEAMLRLAEDQPLRRAMGFAARQRYEEIFGVDAVLPLLVDHYEEACARFDDATARHHSSCLHPWRVGERREVDAVSR